jgi:hypothetical protein
VLKSLLAELVLTIGLSGYRGLEDVNATSLMPNNSGQPDKTTLDIL